MQRRNMTDYERLEDNNVVTPQHTISNPSPVRKAASNRHPSQPHTRPEVGGALAHELAKARFLMQDLADHVFGHIVSTQLARDILQKFIEDKVVLVHNGADASSRLALPLDPKSNDVQRAIQEGFEAADYYACIRSNTQKGGSEPETSSTDKAKKKPKTKKYSFRWDSFPTETLREDELVSFLNDITDRAFEIAKPKLAEANPELHHRFVAPTDKYHAVPLSYEADGEDMRPDFLLVPIEAFSADKKTVDAKYINFTASRLVGEAKNKDLAAGIEQMERYARGLKRAQPWVYYVLGMVVTKDKVLFLRGEGSGTEHLELMLTDGRGCIEFIRILLGLALADKVDLGHNPDVVLEVKEQACKAQNMTRRSIVGSKQRPENDKVASVPTPLPRVPKSRFRRAAQLHSDSAAFFQQEIRSSSAKRVRAEVADDIDEGRGRKKHKTDEITVGRFIFFPIAVYGHKCLGVLFTASSICGRGTTVFCVVDLQDEEKLLAFKLSWQDLARVAEQDAVMERLKNINHPNVIVPLKYAMLSGLGYGLLTRV